MEEAVAKYKLICHSEENAACWAAFYVGICPFEQGVRIATAPLGPRKN
jgi:hypothetical protein